MIDLATTIATNWATFGAALYKGLIEKGVPVDLATDLTKSITNSLFALIGQNQAAAAQVQTAVLGLFSK